MKRKKAWDRAGLEQGIAVMGLRMNRQDLLELYQLASMYGKCYGGKTNDLPEDISEKYRTVTGGEDIREARNPRRAGRKRVYMENTDGMILDMRRRGMPLRRIADVAQCSTGHVQDVLKQHR